jgi:hypothetical protein
MGIADLHIHTHYSWDGTCTVRAALKRAMMVGLDVIAITDHDSIGGCAEAVEIAPEYGVAVIPGCEVSSVEGHILALFIENPIPAGLSLIETLHAIAEQGGIAIAAHPYEERAPSVTRPMVEKALADPVGAGVLLGIEAFNASLIFHKSRPMAEKLPGEVGLAAVGNSDAHISWMIGGGATYFPGQSVADLRYALVHRTTEVLKFDTFHLEHILRRWLPQFLLRKAGWVITNRAPEASFSLARI